MKNAYKLIALFACVNALILCFASAGMSQQTCSGCHPSMAEQPVRLPDSPPADVLLGLSDPCFQYGNVLGEWYYVEELFVTTERHLAELEEARYHVEPLYRQLVASRELYRETVKEPLVSLADFRLKTGKLRYDVGKIYREAKTKRIEQRNRTVFGVIILGTFFMLFLIVTGWRLASGTGVVNPTRTKLGYDALKQAEAKEKEAAE